MRACTSWEIVYRPYTLPGDGGYFLNCLTCGEKIPIRFDIPEPSAYAHWEEVGE